MRAACALAALIAAAVAPPVAAAPPIEAYGQLPSAEMMQLSPSGTRYAFVATLGDKRRLGVVGANGKPLFLNYVGDTKVRDLDWVGDDHLLATISGTIDQPLDFQWSFEAGAVFVFGMDGKNFPVFEHALHVAQTVEDYYGSAQVDGHTYGYFGGYTYTTAHTLETQHLDHDYADVYRIDLDSGEGWLAARGRPGDWRWLFDAKGGVLAHSAYDERSGQWQLFAGEGRAKAIVTQAAPIHRIELIGHGRSPGTALVLNNTGEFDRLEEISVESGKSTDILGHNNEESLLLDPDSGQLIGYATYDEPFAFFFDRRLQARYEAARKAFAGYQVHLESYSRDLGRMIVRTDGGDDSGTYWLVDIASGKADPIGYAYPQIRAADVGPTRLVHYKAADGLAIEGVLTLPPKRKPEKLPLVVLPHGGPIDVRDRLGFDWWAQAYAAAGYAVFQPNYRGSGGYGRAFRDAGFGQWGRKMQTDLSDGVAALAAQGLVDPKRVCIVGGSYGGYAALAGVTLQQGIYRCAVSVAGPSDLYAFFGWQIKKSDFHRSGRTRYWRAVTGADKDGDAVMRSLSPALRADQADAPILLIHGQDDTVVPIEQSQEMYDALKAAGKTVQFVRLPGEDHWLSRQVTRVQMLKAAVAFVKQYDPPD